MPDHEFELDPETYDAMVDWPRRLANEEGFIRRQFEAVGARRVLDAACGLGHHAARFQSWGLSVQGADVSPEMIDHCRRHHGASTDLQWAVRSYADPVKPPASFDAVICTGNSLALAPDRATVDRAVATLLAALRPSGVGIFQILNLWRLTEGPVTWQKCKRLPGPGGERLILKGVHRVGDRGYINFLEVRLRGGQQRESQWHSHGAALLGLRAEEVLAATEAAGGRDAELFGSYQGEPYDPSASPDLILVCRRA